MNAEDSDDRPQADAGGGLAAIGKRLADARRAQERELGAVASALHLNVEVVTALETGNEAGLPASTFVRGYIKSYARLLGLDEQELLAMLPETEGYRPAPLRSVGMRRRRQFDFPLGKWLLWLAVLFVLVMLFIYGAPLVERLLSRGDGTTVEQPDALPLPLGDAAPTLEDAFPPVVPEEAPAPEQEPVAAPPADTGGTPAPEAAADEPAVPSGAPLALPAEPAAAAAGETASAGPAVITLRFTEDSWVEMESHGRKLVVGTQPAGSERTVRAEPPVQVLLGNAPGVVVEYRGKIVDLKPYQRGKVARLVLED